MTPRSTGGGPAPPDSDPIVRMAACAVLLGLGCLGALAGAAWTLEWEGFWRGAGQPYATTLAALAAIGAAAIALRNNRQHLHELREQRSQDQLHWEQQRRRDDIRDLRRRFADATGQLASRSPTIRRSGAYAMIAVAGDWRDYGDESEVRICVSVLAACVTTINPTYSDNADGLPSAGPDGPVRALIVSLLSKYAGSQLQDLWGNHTLLHRADLRAVVFDTPIGHADLSFAQLCHADFTRAPHLAGIVLGAADLTGARLACTDLRGANVVEANLTGATVAGADLRGADLSGATVTGVDFADSIWDEQTRWPQAYSPPTTLHDGVASAPNPRP